jgi:serine/threonine protein phosphatase 1
MSDIHGCYEEYLEALEKIHFCDKDELYILGDVTDRGPEPIKVLQDLMMRPNVTLILGNHDYMALKILKKLNVEIKADNYSSHLTQKDLMDYFYWTEDGGKTTADAFKQLSQEEKIDILEYLEDASLWEEVYVNGKTFLCVHADFHGVLDGKTLEELALTDFLFHRAAYDKRYFSNPNTFMVTGHTPTMLLHATGSSDIYEANGHIAIDCGCVYGKQLAVYCADTGITTYVKSKR